MLLTWFWNGHILNLDAKVWSFVDDYACFAGFGNVVRGGGGVGFGFGVCHCDIFLSSSFFFIM